MATKFDEIWLPRIGEAATSELHRNGLLTIILGPLVIILIVISSVGFGSKDSTGEIVGAISLVLVVTFCAGWFQSRSKLTKRLSEKFETKIKWYEVPRMNARQFDDWCLRRNFKSVQ
jgi:hypothetical protein